MSESIKNGTDRSTNAPRREGSGRRRIFFRSFTELLKLFTYIFLIILFTKHIYLVVVVRVPDELPPALGPLPNKLKVEVVVLVEAEELTVLLTT